MNKDELFKKLLEDFIDSISGLDIDAQKILIRELLKCNEKIDDNLYDKEGMKKLLDKVMSTIELTKNNDPKDNLKKWGTITRG